MTKQIVKVVTLPLGAQASAIEGALDKFNRSLELRIPIQISFANLPAKHLNVGSQFVSQFYFLGGQPRSARNILTGHPHTKPPEKPKHDNDGANNSDNAKKCASQHSSNLLAKEQRAKDEEYN